MTAEAERYVYTDAKEIYGRAQTAIAMAKAESCKLRSYLEKRAADLRLEADAIDLMLEKAGEHTDAWYDVIVAENNALRELERKKK